jgi:dihydrofolate reductase
MKLIVACDTKGGIGYKNKLPWTKIQGDLPRFKELTDGKIIVMGRNTYESLPTKPLPNRINIVISSKEIPNVTVYSTLPETDTLELHDAYLIGGAQLINTSWHLIDEVYLTRTFIEYKCDCYIDLKYIGKYFTCVRNQYFTDHTFEIWKRKSWNNTTTY